MAETQPANAGALLDQVEQFMHDVVIPGEDD